MQYSLRIPDDDELIPEYSLWMYDSPRENLELDIWRRSWLIWKKNITKIYELSVIEFVFSRWGIYQKNENTPLFKKLFFPTGMTIVTKSSRYGIIVTMIYDHCTVFTCYVLHYIETQRISWLNYIVHANLHKIHTDKINHLSIYVRNTETLSSHLPNSDKVLNVQHISPRSRVTKDFVNKEPTLPILENRSTGVSDLVPAKRVPSFCLLPQITHHQHCDTPRSNWFC